MSALPHSPGPWKLDEVRTSSGRAYRIGTGEMLVAGKGCCIIYDDYPNGNRSNERTANAQLIRASPELLAKLRELVSTARIWMAGDDGTEEDRWRLMEAREDAADLVKQLDDQAS